MQLLVPIKCRHRQPFSPKLPSNYVNAVVLSFADRKAKVARLLQVINHGGRTFFVQQEGLKGFLVVGNAEFDMKNLSTTAKEIILQLERDMIDGKLHFGKWNLVMIWIEISISKCKALT